jgi:AcrR family transcriptional regulator
MLQKDCEKLDPRIRRTRQLLQDALRKLLEHKDFSEISVQDVSEAATVNRATFYAHYADKFALLGELTRVSFLKLLEQRNVMFDGTCATAFHPIILAVCDYLTDLQKSRSFNQHQFDPFVERTIIDQIRIILLDGFERHPVSRTVPQEMIAAAASWAIYGAAKEWVNTPDRSSAEEFVSAAAELVRPILTAGTVAVPGSEPRPAPSQPQL